MKNSSLLRILGYVIVISFGIMGVGLKETMGNDAQYIIFAGLPLGMGCIIASYKMERQREKQT